MFLYVKCVCVVVFLRLCVFVLLCGRGWGAGGGRETPNGSRGSWEWGDFEGGESLGEVAPPLRRLLARLPACLSSGGGVVSSGKIGKVPSFSKVTSI